MNPTTTAGEVLIVIDRYIRAEASLADLERAVQLAKLLRKRGEIDRQIDVHTIAVMGEPDPKQVKALRAV